MAEAPFSDEDSSPSIKLFSQSSDVEEGNSLKAPSPDEDLVPLQDFQLNEGERNEGAASGVSDDVEQQISEGLDQLSTSNNENGDDSDDEEFRKQVRIGNHYQARIPKYFGDYNGEVSYEGEDTLLWDSFRVEPEVVDTFLKRASSANRVMIPMGSHLRDDEHALFVLQENEYDVDKSLERLTMSDLSSPTVKMPVWSEEECKNFELGLVRFGKNFLSIQRKKLGTRRVSELVQFYYLWKKSERYDLFAHRIRAGKKKYAMNPGISDLMNKYMKGQMRKCTNLTSDVQFLLGDDKKDVTQSDVQY